MRRKWYHVLEVCKMMCTELNAIFSLICSSHENFLIHAPMDMLKAVGSEYKSFCIYFLKLSPIFEISLTRKTPSHSLCTGIVRKAGHKFCVSALCMQPRAHLLTIPVWRGFWKNNLKRLSEQLVAVARPRERTQLSTWHPYFAWQFCMHIQVPTLLFNAGEGTKRERRG